MCRRQLNPGLQQLCHLALHTNKNSFGPQSTGSLALSSGVPGAAWSAIRNDGRYKYITNREVLLRHPRPSSFSLTLLLPLPPCSHSQNRTGPGWGRPVCLPTPVPPVAKHAMALIGKIAYSQLHLCEQSVGSSGFIVNNCICQDPHLASGHCAMLA